MRETFKLMNDMANLQAQVVLIERDLHDRSLSDDEREELQARMIYLQRHIRMAATILDTNIDVMMNNAYSTMTDKTREILKEMAFDRGTAKCVTVRSKAMQRIASALEKDRLKTFKY